MKNFFIIMLISYFNNEIAAVHQNFLQTEITDIIYKTPSSKAITPIYNTINLTNDSSKYSVEELTVQLEIQELINIRNEIEKIYNKQDIQKIKELNIKAKKELKEKKNNKEEIVLLSLYEKQEEILIRIAAQEENLIKLTKEYEDKINKFLILQNKSNTHKYNDHFNYTDIAKLSIELNKSYKEITILEKKIQAAKKEETNLKESMKKNNIIISTQNTNKEKYNHIEETINKNFLETEKIKEAEKQNEILENTQLAISTLSHETQCKILKIEKKFTQEKISKIKEYLNVITNKKKITSNKYFQKEKEQLENNQKKLLIKKDLITESIEKTSKYNDTLNNKDLKKKTGTIINSIKNQPEQNQIINDINLIFDFIKIDLQLINLIMINSKIYINKKNLELIDGWYLFWQSEINNKIINDAIKNCNPVIIKNNNNDFKIELQKYIERITIYNNFLNNIIQLSKINENLKSYAPQAKNFIDNLTEKNNKINILLTNIKDIFHIASILEEELKFKTFWARSEYSISFLKLKNFIPEIKLFFFELKEKFYSFIKIAKNKIIQLPQYSLFKIIQYLLFIFFIIISAFFYKKIFSKLSIIIDNIEQQSYYIRKISSLIAILSHRSIFFYLWLNIFICIYNKIFSFYYLDALFYLFSIPFACHFINILLNDFFHNKDEEINQNRSMMNYIENFVYKKLLIYTIIFLFFFRQAFLNLIQGNAHEIILAAQFILTQIQLIILLKKNYIIQYVTEIKLLDDKIKYFISQYYQLFIALIITLIVLSTPYVGYGYQMLYIFSRSILTLLLLPIFNFMFNTIKIKSLSVFFNFEDGEAKNKIKIGKMFYISFLSLSFFIIFSIAGFIILKLWGYSIQINSIYNLFYANLLPTQDILSNEAITSLSINTLFTVFFYIVKGYFLSYCINNFICAKILNPIVIGQTMQNTIMTLFKYIIVCSCFIIGLCTAGLQSIITKLGALIIALSFALKEPVADFISYFIILIQCPIKVGDVIKINKEGGGSEIEVVGIVRSINSRTTVIRQKNSQTIIVPNSIILKRSICNWTYQKSGFTAIEDFFITIDKKHDPEIVRILLVKIAESCHGVIKAPTPLIRCENITPVGYDFLIRAYINIERAADQWDIASHLRILIIKKLEIEKISFAIPVYKLTINKFTNEIDI